MISSTFPPRPLSIHFFPTNHSPTLREAFLALRSFIKRHYYPCLRTNPAIRHNNLQKIYLIPFHPLLNTQFQSLLQYMWCVCMFVWCINEVVICTMIYIVPYRYLIPLTLFVFNRLITHRSAQVGTIIVNFSYPTLLHSFSLNLCSYREAVYYRNETV